MLKQFLAKIPNHIKLVVKIYLLNLVLFLGYRLIFYTVNQSSDIDTVPMFEKIWAFRMGLEFDTAVFCWITFLPWTIWSVAYFFNKPTIYKIGFYLFLGFQLLYHFICIANIPYFTQFGSHLNKNALLWSEEPSFVFGLIFGSIYYWGYILLYLFMGIILVKASLKLFLNFKIESLHKLKPKWYNAVIVFSLFTGLLVLGSRGRI